MSTVISGHPVGGATLHVWGVASAPRPPGPSNIILLHQLGHIPDIIVPTIALGSAIDDTPLVHEEWDIVLVSEGEGEVLEVLAVPGVVEDLALRSTVGAALIAPSWIKYSTLILVFLVAIEGYLARLLGGPVLGHEVVKGVNDVGQVHVDFVREGPQLVEASGSDHAWCIWIRLCDRFATLIVELLNLRSIQTLISWLTHDLVSGDVVPGFVPVDNMLPGGEEFPSEL